METVADENPLRSATSRMVMADGERLRGASEGTSVETLAGTLAGNLDAWRRFAGAAFRVGFESRDSMHLNFSLLLADTTGR
jgi:hypothetical protein